jgi:hypothetical protein
MFSQNLPKNGHLKTLILSVKSLQSLPIPITMRAFLQLHSSWMATDMSNSMVWVKFIGETGFGANDTMGFSSLARVGTIKATRFFSERLPVQVSEVDLPVLLDTFRTRIVVMGEPTYRVEVTLPTGDVDVSKHHTLESTRLHVEESAMLPHQAINVFASGQAEPIASAGPSSTPLAITTNEATQSLLVIW